MREAQLRNVLLVRSIEETDGTESLVPDADRKAATREALRNVGIAQTVDTLHASGLSRRAQRLLAARAELLVAPRLHSHPFIRNLAYIGRSSAWLGWLLIVASALFGAALSALDGTRRIDVLSLPIFGLVLWNFLLYAALLIRAVRPKRPGLISLRRLFLDAVVRRIRRFATKSGDYSAALAQALDRFAGDWAEAIKPLMLARATRLFHMCAAAAGIGLICATYLRSFTLDYAAGWESTFLTPENVHAIVAIFYGPASALTEIPLPGATHLAAIRWEGGRGGERAAYWIHLIAVSIMVYIVVPRLVLAAVSTVAIWRHVSSMVPPQSLGPYFSKTFGPGAVAGFGTVTVVPYGYEPAVAALHNLRHRVSAVLGEAVTIDTVHPVSYGDEAALLRALPPGRKRGPLILLVNLAATPESENHGEAIERARRFAAPGTSRGALVLVDEGPYGARMMAHGGAAERMHERRRLWQSFIEERGAVACFFDLESRDEPPIADADAFRTAILQS